MNNIITVRDLVKVFGPVKALDNLSLDFKKGINGFLGPNGAGKTTTLMILIGLLAPDSGEIDILGMNPIENSLEVKNLLGYFPEFDVLNIDVEADKFIVHMGMISGLSRETAVKQLNRIAVFLDMGEEIHRSLTTLSQGMKQKVKLAIALIHDPEILLLDEPTSGLDPISRERMLSLIRVLHEDLGKDIILSTHILRDVEQVCDHLVLINSGRTIFEGPKDRILKPIIRRIGLRVSVKASERNKKLVNIFKELGYESYYNEEENMIYVIPQNSKDVVIREIIKIVYENGFELRSLKEIHPTLDDVFEQILRRGSLEHNSN